MYDLKGKTAIVTGSSRGIGEAIVKKLAENGAHVIVHYAKNRDKAIAIQEEITFNGGQADLIQADFSDPDNLTHFFDGIEKILNDKKPDILVNNAAIANHRNLMDINGEQLDRLFLVNVKAPFFITRWAAGRMNDGGRIINISSKASKTPTHQSGVYAMTKAALDNLTIVMASMLGSRKITVNSVAPGPILTDMNRQQFANEEIRKRVENGSAMKGIGEPKNVADVVSFLSSDEAGWITAQWIEVSGGLGI